MTGFTRAISNEFAEFEITCNHVAPGHMEQTPKPGKWDQQPSMDPNYYDRWIREHVPSGRRGRTKEIADMCVYLASEKGSYITGQTIPINGGMVFVWAAGPKFGDAHRGKRPRSFFRHAQIPQD